MPLRHGAADQFGEHVVLAVEVEVERAAGNPGRREDVSHGEIAEVMLGEQAGRRGQDGLAQVRPAFAAGRRAAPLRPAGALTGTR